MEYIGNRLATQLHGTVLTSLVSNMQFKFDVQIGQNHSVANLTVNSSCLWPVQVTYERWDGQATNTVINLGSVDQLLQYLVTNLRD